MFCMFSMTMNSKKLNRPLQCEQPPAHNTSYFSSQLVVSNQSHSVADIIVSPSHIQTNSHSQKPVYVNVLPPNTSHRNVSSPSSSTSSIESFNAK